MNDLYLPKMIPVPVLIFLKLLEESFYNVYYVDLSLNAPSEHDK